MILGSLLLSSLFAVNPRLPVRPQFPPKLEASARAMLTNFTAGQFDAASANFSASMRETVSPAVLADMKKQIEAQVGSYEGINEVNQKKADGFRVVELIARYEKSPVSVRVVFDQQDQIGAAYFDPLPEPPINEELETKARTLLANFNAAKFDTVVAEFRQALRVQLPMSRLQKLSEDVTKRFGRFRSIDKVRQMTGNNLTTIEFIATYDKEPSRVWVVFDTYRRVAGLHIGPVQTVE
jgi:hypothetical protein